VAFSIPIASLVYAVYLPLQAPSSAEAEFRTLRFSNFEMKVHSAATPIWSGNSPDEPHLRWLFARAEQLHTPGSLDTLCEAINARFRQTQGYEMTSFAWGSMYLIIRSRSTRIIMSGLLRINIPGSQLVCPHLGGTIAV
jgi:hypothetical protein